MSKSGSLWQKAKAIGNCCANCIWLSASQLEVMNCNSYKKLLLTKRKR